MMSQSILNDKANRRLYQLDIFEQFVSFVTVTLVDKYTLFSILCAARIYFNTLLNFNFILFVLS
ncbi:hypothetical protein CBL_09342 [Carabus blaptoides fortunei]